MSTFVKKAIIRGVSLLGFIFFPLLVLFREVKVITDLMYSQTAKYLFKSPRPLFVSFTPPLFLVNPKYVELGDGVRISEYSTISVWGKNNLGNKPIIHIGNNVRIGAFSHITAINSIFIEDNVLIGKSVTISDNSHGYGDYSDLSSPPKCRKLYSKGPVRIKQNVWIGDKATVLPGVCIGEFSIIGANTVVTKDIPPYSIVCGNPGRIIKQLTKSNEES